MKPLRPGDHTSWQGTYIQFHYAGATKSGKTHKWNVKNGETDLGEIKWFSRWRKYAFFPVASTVYEETCLSEIASFLRLAPQVAPSTQAA